MDLLRCYLYLLALLQAYLLLLLLLLVLRWGPSRWAELQLLADVALQEVLEGPALLTAPSSCAGTVCRRCSNSKPWAR
jgi:hypothetical protein